MGLNRMQDGWLYGTSSFILLNQYEWGKKAKVVRTGEDIDDIIWEREIGTTTLKFNTVVDLKPTPEGNWVAIGQWETPLPQPPFDEPNYLGGFTFKFSSDGDSLWSRLDTAFWHPVCGSENHLGGVAVLPSGSVIAAGYANTNCYPPTVRSWGWVLKISKDGCIDTLLCSGITPVEEVQPAVELRVWPNPASTYVDFFFQNPSDDGRKRLIIMDMTGRTVRAFDVPEDVSSIRWDTGTNPSGIYYYQLIANDISLQSGKIILDK